MYNMDGKKKTLRLIPNSTETNVERTPTIQDHLKTDEQIIMVQKKVSNTQSSKKQEAIVLE